MGETLIQRRRVLEEALRGVKSFSGGGTPLEIWLIFKTAIS